MGKPVLISGIQPSGRLHIGNYLGALKHFVELQETGKYECLFFAADLHSLTEPFAPKEKRKEVTELLKAYRAAGLSPEQSTLFVQSAVPAHTELMWYLATVTPYGDLARMTQFKDKSAHEPKNVNAGLLTYPILMAADILLYDAAIVPVGEDQLQHLEFARMLARKFNKRFGKTFTEPKPLMTDIPRLMALDEPGEKMSKSRPKGCLFLDDAPEAIREKIAAATTDSEARVVYDEKRKQGVSNLIRIYAAFAGESVKDVERSFDGKGYQEFKTALAELLIQKLESFREAKYAEEELERMAAAGNENARQRADAKLAEVKEKLGLE